MNETSPLKVFSFPSFPVLCFGSILMLCSLIGLWRREAIENLGSVCSWLTASDCHKGGCSLDKQSSANLISCCHTFFPLTITGPPLPSFPLPLFCQSWFCCVQASLFLADSVYFQHHIIRKSEDTDSKLSQL